MTDNQTGRPATPEANPGPAPATLIAPPRLLRWAARHGYGLLALVCVLLWLPGILSLPALDRDESRFAQSSRQMLDSGNYVDIRFGQVPRYKKPVGIYWLQAAATAVAGPLNRDRHGDAHIWTYRLPSLLGATAAVWLTFWSASLFSAEAGLLAGLMMATSILLTAEATIATTDAVLLACVTGMQGVLLRVWRAAKDDLPQPSRLVLLAGWGAMAVGILVKGPVTPAVAAATVILLMAAHWLAHRKDASGKWARNLDWRWLGHLKPVQGLLLTVLVTAPWLVAISLESHGAFLQQSLGGDFAAKLAGGQESHGAPPGYFLLLAALTFWPAILFILPALALAVTRRQEPAIRFLLAWAASWWLVVEIVPTKLPQYVLPAYPALAILAALWLLSPKADPAPASPLRDADAAPADAQPSPQRRNGRRILPLIAAFQFLIGLGVLAAAPFLLPKYFGLGPPAWPVMTAAAVTALCGIAALVILLTGRRLMAVIPAFAPAFIIIPALTAVVGPALSQLWVTDQLAALVAKDRLSSDPAPMLAGYEEPSMLFALGADIALTDGRRAAEMGANQGGIALIQDDERPAFLARLAELEDSALALDDLSAFNYSRGKEVHITLYRVAPLHPVVPPRVQ